MIFHKTDKQLASFGRSVAGDINVQMPSSTAAVLSTDREDTPVVLFINCPIAPKADAAELAAQRELGYQRGVDIVDWPIEVIVKRTRVWKPSLFRCGSLRKQCREDQYSSMLEAYSSLK
jgi:hypothetical protein